MFCFWLGPDMKCSESFIKSFEKKLNLLKLFRLGKTFMDLDVEKSVFKDFFFPLIIMIFPTRLSSMVPQTSPFCGPLTPRPRFPVPLRHWPRPFLVSDAARWLWELRNRSLWLRRC